MRPSRTVAFATTLVAVAALALALALALSASRAAAQSDVRAFRTPDRITLDGRFNEPDWARADSITDFRQRDPDEGALASERTVVRLLATPDGLAVGWWCSDREPDRIVRSQLRRDASLNADDNVAFVVDGLHDRRSGFYFRANANGANANGARSDAEHLTFESGNEDWDGVWDVRAQVTGTGYQVGMLIPWGTLRYAQSDSVFGMNFRRFIPRKNEQVLNRGWKRTEGFRFLEREALVSGFTQLPARPKVELRPYAHGGPDGQS
ncbi:carbohydrate binding family 9 domain-containing protein [Gemmatimonas sp.]|uniref:carbohydrate binding family 9 domain-containing protein n=1 Tax=Gemmatimonas sp. TaxID=1962908 RepID=UPI00356A5830